MNNIEFQDSTFRTIHLGQEAGNIEIGEYKANDKINVLISEDLPRISNIDHIHFHTEASSTTAEVSDFACEVKVQNRVVMYCTQRKSFNVDPNSGEITVANDIVGGHHGALDYESWKQLRIYSRS